MQEGPIDIDQYELITGAYTNENAVAEERDTLERNRYIEKIRSAQKVEIIGCPIKMGDIYRDLLSETTHEVLSDMGRRDEMYFGTAIQYIKRFLWRLVGYLPEKDTQVWDMFQGHPQEYFTAIRIRDAAISTWNALGGNFLIGSNVDANFAVSDYIQRLQLLGNEKGATEGISIAWGDVRIGDQCLLTLLNIQTLTNITQMAADGKINCHAKCPQEGKAGNQQ